MSLVTWAHRKLLLQVSPAQKHKPTLTPKSLELGSLERGLGRGSQAEVLSEDPRGPSGQALTEPFRIFLWVMVMERVQGAGLRLWSLSAEFLPSDSSFCLW